PEKIKSIWPLTPGKSVTYQVTRSSGGVWNYTLRVERFERITVAAGEFDCVVVTLTQQGFGPQGYGDQFTFWYAPEVGFWIKRTWEWRAGTYPRPAPQDVEVARIVRP